MLVIYNFKHTDAEVLGVFSGGGGGWGGKVETAKYRSRRLEPAVELRGE